MQKPCISQRRYRIGAREYIAGLEWAVAASGEDEGRPDELTLARIERERDEASRRLAKTRDIAPWQATMARLDAETEVAMKPRQQRRLEPAEVVAHLRSLPKLWKDAGPESHQALASALFTKLEVEGYQKMRYELTPDAVDPGLGAALLAQPTTRPRPMAGVPSDQVTWPGPSVVTDVRDS